MEAWLAGRAGRDRRLGRARAWCPRRPPRRAASAPRSRSRRSRSASGSPTTTSPRSSTWSPRRSASAGRWIHYGLTSSDVLDTALGAAARARPGEILVARRARATATRSSRGRASTRDTLCVGRTHGVHAEPTTFGLQARRLRLRGRPQPRAARAARSSRRAVGKLSGAVGTYASTPPAVEARGAWSGSACAREDVSTQVVPRDRHAELLAARSRSPAPASSASRPRSATCSAPRCARSRSRSAPARRARRRCRTSATRSLTERIAGLARVLRGYAQAGLENVALWHERDISHSGAERVVLPDATILLDYMQHLATRRGRGDDRPRRPDAREPRAHPRRALQPARADRAGRVAG